MQKQVSETQQNFRDDCNINKMIARFKKGETPLGNAIAPKYGDFSTHLDFHKMQNQIVEAKQQFMALPAKIRGRFSNSPEKLIQFLSDEKNLDEAIKLGIVEKPVVAVKPAPVDVNVIPSPEESGGAPKS